MTSIPQAAIDAAAEALHEPCICGTDASHEEQMAWATQTATTALEAAEEAWPHDPPKRDLTGTTNGQFERGPAKTMHRRDARPPGPARPPFGFGTPEARA